MLALQQRKLRRVLDASPRTCARGACRVASWRGARPASGVELPGRHALAGATNMTRACSIKLRPKWAGLDLQYKGRGPRACKTANTRRRWRSRLLMGACVLRDAVTPQGAACVAEGHAASRGTPASASGHENKKGQGLLVVQLAPAQPAGCGRGWDETNDVGVTKVRAGLAAPRQPVQLGAAGGAAARRCLMHTRRLRAGLRR
jgi:hypothetical protein